MQVSLADIHADPESPTLKLSYAAQFADWSDPRGELIRAQEAFRHNPKDSEAGNLCLRLAAQILHSVPNRYRVLDRLCELLEDRYLVMFGADCAERALWLFEATRPGDDRPRRAIQAARAFAAGRIKMSEMHAIGEAAWRAARESGEDIAEQAGSAAATAALFGAEIGGSNPLEYASFAIGDYGKPGSSEGEGRWQTGRLIDLWLYGWDYPLPVSERSALEGILKLSTESDRRVT
jgi:hypothetical protein